MKVLKGLISSLLRLNPQDIRSVTILNPIRLGKAFDERTFILDLKVLLNNAMVINLEMQVARQDFWNDRSLIYLCNIFNHLKSGDDYSKIKPACHIGILDFTPFPEYPEFYATNKIMNVRACLKNHSHHLHAPLCVIFAPNSGCIAHYAPFIWHKSPTNCDAHLAESIFQTRSRKHYIYNDKFTLNVLDLKQINLATDEDKKWKLDDWARLFKAKTWEELKMLAHKNDVFNETFETMYKLNQDEVERYWAEARKKALRISQSTEHLYKKSLEEKDIEIAGLQALLKRVSNTL